MRYLDSSFKRAVKYVEHPSASQAGIRTIWLREAKPRLIEGIVNLLIGPQTNCVVFGMFFSRAEGHWGTAAAGLLPIARLLCLASL